MLLPLAGIPLIDFVYNHCLTSQRADLVAVVTSESPSDDILHAHCVQQQIPVFRGPLENVLARYLAAANYYTLRSVCRVCGDSPFVAVEMIDRMIEEMHSNPYEYAIVENCIDGFMAEFIPVHTLQELASRSLTQAEEEHVTLAIRNNLHRYNALRLDMNQTGLAAKISLTIDTAADLEFCNSIAATLMSSSGRPRFHFNSLEIVAILDQLLQEESYNHAGPRVS